MNTKTFGVALAAIAGLLALSAGIVRSLQHGAIEIAPLAAGLVFIGLAFYFRMQLSKP